MVSARPPPEMKPSLPWWQFAWVVTGTTVSPSDYWGGGKTRLDQDGVMTSTTADRTVGRSRDFNSDEVSALVAIDDGGDQSTIVDGDGVSVVTALDGGVSCNVERT